MATMAYAGGKARATERVMQRRIPLALLVALAIGVVLNVVLFLIGQAAGPYKEPYVLSNGNELGLPAILTFTVGPTILGAIVYAILGAIGRIKRPITVFRIISLGIVLLSLLSPFTLPGASFGLIVMLELAHFVVAGAVVWSLTTLAGERG